MKRAAANHTLLALVLCAPRVAHAEEEQRFSVGAKPVWYALAGVTTGNSLVAHDRGGYVGGEPSVLRLSRAGRFFGFYGDGYYDFGAARAYATTGVELGYKIFGIDAGALLLVAHSRRRAGSESDRPA